MSPHRSPALPPTTTIRLEDLDPASVRLAIALSVGGLVLMFAAVMGTAFVPREHRELARVAALSGLFVVVVVSLLALRPRMKRLRHFLELGEVGTGRIRLLAPNGGVLADTTNGSLRITRTNYTRAGRHGAAWLRPGFRVQHPGGSFLVGTLYPQLPWDAAPHDPMRPDFELLIPDHEALAERVRSHPT